MKPSTQRFLLLAVAAVPMLAAPAVLRAQFQVDNSRANDANNRIGSGGYNTGDIPAPETVTGNQIVTGNVTGGKYFRGPVGYSAPNEFSGPTGTGVSDRFIRDSSGPQVSYNRAPNNYANNVMPYYSTTATPPPTFVETPSGGGYVPAVSPSQYRQLTMDERLGIMTNANQAILPQPGQLILPGPVDPSANQTFISASPLYGIRQFSVGDPGAVGILSGASTLTPNGRPPLSDEQVMQMRRELQQSLNTRDVAPPGPLGPAETAPAVPGSTSLTAPPPPAMGTPNNQSLSPKALGGAIGTEAGSLGTGQGTENRLLTSPTQQSSQYAKMRQRLNAMNQGQTPQTDEEKNREFRAQLRAQQEQQQNAQPGQAAPGQGMPGQAAPGQAAPGSNLPPPPKAHTPGELGVQEDLGAKARKLAEGPVDTHGKTLYPPSVSRPEPVEVRSLATGVTAPGLRDLLQQAETQMQQGKFDTAMTDYENAAQVAPNNPMILLGQANAELGGEYYSRAENHLRQAFLLDPTLLMARYNLRSMLGAQRLETVVDNLKDVARKQPNQAQAPFLLAYIAYNNHDSARAASYLDLAEQRAGGPDPVIRLLRTHWDLPRTAGAAPATRPAEMNK